MFVNVQFPLKTKQTSQSNMILIPESALIRQGQLTGIYTIGNGNVAILRWLRTGKLWQQIEVLSDYQPTEIHCFRRRKTGRRLVFSKQFSVQ
jgi:hypothetical protein